MRGSQVPLRNAVPADAPGHSRACKNDQRVIRGNVPLSLITGLRASIRGIQGGEAAQSGHSGSVDDKLASGARRREEIEQRLAAIRTRMDELKTVRPDDASPAAVTERIASAQRQAAASQAAAEQAIAASIRAFRRSAEAHEQTALQYERAAAAGFGDKDQHERQAARHRAAAATDTQRAERARSLLRDEEARRMRPVQAGPLSSGGSRRSKDLT
jgi:hypothetical protein